MRNLIVSLVIVAAGCLAAAPARAVSDETNLKITVRAGDAGFIGTSMGGARVIVTDRNTGDILASGVTHGASGDAALMTGGAARDAVLAGEDTAALEFSLELIEPVPVTVTATAPGSQPQAQASVSQDMILIPGKDYTAGNGIMLALPGLAVDVLSPPAHMTEKYDPEQTVTLMTNVLKMSGNPVEKNSPWPPERYQVEVSIYKDGLFLNTGSLEYTGKPGLFTRLLKFPKPGSYRLLVTAFDSATMEAGIDETTIVLSP